MAGREGDRSLRGNNNKPALLPNGFCPVAHLLMTYDDDHTARALSLSSGYDAFHYLPLLDVGVCCCQQYQRITAEKDSEASVELFIAPNIRLIKWISLMST